MDSYNIGDEYIRSVGSSSLGMTIKYYYEGFWYKENYKGYEGKAEAVVSSLLSFTNLADSMYVHYDECLINGKSGCRSKNFLKEEESLATFSRIYQKQYGGSLKEKVALYSDPSDRIKYVLDMIYEATGVEVDDYLSNVMQVDYLTLDVDRHFDNLALIKSDLGYRVPPLFDFGASYFSLQHVFKPEMSLEQKLAIMTPQPFSHSLEEQMKVMGAPSLRIDYLKAHKYLSSLPDYISEPALYQLENARQYFGEIKHEKMTIPPGSEWIYKRLFREEINAARDEGREEGIGIGEKMGEDEKIAQVVRNMVAKGYQYRDIVDVTGVSDEGYRYIVNAYQIDKGEGILYPEIDMTKYYEEKKARESKKTTGSSAGLEDDFFLE